MDLKECLEILGLTNASSQKQVEAACRNMFNTWNPDRFPFVAKLRKHARKKLRNINLAYDRLSAHLSTEHDQDQGSWLDRKPDPRSKPGERPGTAGQYTKSPYTRSATNKTSGPPRPTTVYEAVRLGAGANFFSRLIHGYRAVAAPGRFHRFHRQVSLRAR